MLRMTKGLALLVAVFMLGGVTARASTITIGSFDGSVSARPFTFGAFSNLITDLQNPANFGLGGIDPNSVTIAAAVSSVNAAILSGYQVFVMDEVSSLSSAQATALANFVTGGGRLVIVDDSGGSGAVGANAVLSLLDGSSVTSGFAGGISSTGGSITNAGLSSNGLFGNLVGGTFAVTPGSPLIAGSRSIIVGTNSANFLMETYVGSGAVLTTADVSFQNFFVPPASLPPGNINNALLFENFISTPSSAVPEPTSLALLCSGLAGLLARGRGRKARRN